MGANPMNSAWRNVSVFGNEGITLVQATPKGSSNAAFEFVHQPASTSATSMPKPSACLQEIQKQFEKIASLPVDWTGYDAKEVSPSIAQTAYETLERIITPRMPAPHLFLTPAGGVQAEWHINNVDLEIEFESLTQVYIVFDDLDAPTESWSGEMDIAHLELDAYLGRLYLRRDPGHEAA